MPNSELDNYQLSDIAYFAGPMTITKSGRSKKFPQPFWCMLYTHNYYDNQKMGEQKTKYAGNKITSYKAIEKVNKKFNISDSNNFEQDMATPKEIAEYNKLAKHYNAMSKQNMVIKLKHVERLKLIYNKMNTEQKNDAEPFPNFPPPPPAPHSPQSKKEEIEAIKNYIQNERKKNNLRKF